MPSMPGSIRSSTITSGWWSRASSTARSPSAALATSKPSRSKYLATRRTSGGSSSTTSARRRAGNRPPAPSAAGSWVMASPAPASALPGSRDGPARAPQHLQPTPVLLLVDLAGREPLGQDPRRIAGLGAVPVEAAEQRHDRPDHQAPERDHR